MELCNSIQSEADNGNITAIYEGIKKAIGPVPKQTAPLKTRDGEITSDRTDQLKRWT